MGLVIVPSVKEAQLHEKNMKYYYYHWFWGLSKTKVGQPLHANNMARLVDELKQNEAQFSQLKQQELSIKGKNVLVRFFYWLFNINNYVLNRHQLSIMGAHIKNTKSSEKECMVPNSSWFHNKFNSTYSRNCALQPESADGVPLTVSPLPDRNACHLEPEDDKYFDDQMDIVDKIQLIFAGQYDYLGVSVLPPDLENYCHPLDKLIYKKVLLPNQEIAMKPNISRFDSISKKDHETLKKYQSRFNKIIILIQTELYILSDRFFYQQFQRRLKLNPFELDLGMPSDLRVNYARTICEVESLLLKNLGFMYSELPWHKEVGILSKDKFFIHQLGLRELPPEEVSVVNKEELRITSKDLAHLTTLGIQKSVGDTVTLHDIKKTYNHAAILYHPDKGGQNEQFQQLQHAKEKLEQRFVNSYDQKKRQDQYQDEMMNYLQFLWGTKQTELETKMDSIALTTEKKISIWHMLLQEKKKRIRNDISLYISDLEARIKNLQDRIDGIDCVMQLKEAIESNNLEKVEILLNQGVSPDGKLRSFFPLIPDVALLEGNEPLFLASSSKEYAIFKTLIEANADVSIKSVVGYSLAEKIGINCFWTKDIKKEMLVILSQKNVSLPLTMYAACIGDGNIVAAQEDKLTIMDNFHSTTLHYAAANNDVNLCTILCGSDSTFALLDKKNKQGNTAFMLACNYEHTNVKKLLISYYSIKLESLPQKYKSYLSLPCATDGENAIKHHNLQLIIKEECYGLDHHQVAITLVKLSYAYDNLKDYSKQRNFLERALKIQETHYGHDHYEVAMTLMSLSNAYRNLKHPTKQRDLLERALKIREKHYGQGHSQVAITLVNLSNVYRDLGNTIRQRDLLERALIIKEAHYGRDHSELAITLSHLATAYYKLKQPCIALKNAQRAYQILMNHSQCGEDYPIKKECIDYFQSVCKFTLEDLQSRQAISNTQAVALTNYPGTLFNQGESIVNAASEEEKTENGVSKRGCVVS